MLRQLFDVPHSQPFLLACSGGVDSMAIADFYRRGRKTFRLAYFHHGTSLADKMLEVVNNFAIKNSIPFLHGCLTRERKKDESPEAYWRVERYAWLLSHDLPVVTAHHLDDAVETWIFSALHGHPKVIAPKNGKVWRPFLLNEKTKLIEWCTNHNVDWLEDVSNSNLDTPRNRIRHRVIDECLLINPGLKKVIKKKIQAVIDDQSTY